MEWSKAAFSVLAVAAAMFATPADALAARQNGGSDLHITVRIDDKAGVQGAIRKLAESRAAEVFAMSGVKVKWIDGEDANRLKIVAPYTILIMAEAPGKLKAAMERLGTDVMGQGAPFIGRAYIYYDRVLQLRPNPPRDLASTLGDVIAHELGHLLLPPGHSTLGIMRPSVNMTSRRVETFTEDEAVQLRGLLRERAASANTELRTPNPEPNSEN